MHVGRLAIYLAVTASPVIAWSVFLLIYNHCRQRQADRDHATASNTSEDDGGGEPCPPQGSDREESPPTLPLGWHWLHRDRDGCG